MKSLQIVPTIFLTLAIAFLATTGIAMEKPAAKAPAEKMTPIALAIELVNLESEQKNAWFTLEQKYKNQMFDLLKKQHSEIFASKIKQMEAMQKSGFSEGLISEGTQACLSLQMQHHAEWRKLALDKETEAKALDAKQSKELADFQKMLPAAPAA